ncbi:hypothetical protein ZWY2020_009146 [Hordeum vulgare]|nr:hypothetical protein ZWY2020_009146 [Hordeum vulgare]
MALARTVPLPQLASASPLARHRRCRLLLPAMPKERGLPARGIACRAATTATTTPAAVAAVGVGEDLPEGYEQMMPTVDASQRRRAGVLLHPTSLRGPHGIGDLGDQALAFLDWLHGAGCTLWQAAERLLQSPGELRRQYDEFKKNPDVSGWLEDAALFAAIDNSINAVSWSEWPEPLKDRHPGALKDMYENQKDFIENFMAQQFLFEKQWKRVRSHAQKLGISIMGDMPIYVGYHSADVWANRKSFLLDKNGFPTFVSGVPPDAFSETGQLWNSPLYDWKSMEADGFAWWVKRIKRALDLYDEFRIDHFRGLAGFWAVPSGSEVAMFGSWRAGPRNAFFDALFKAVGKINIIAEDLGVITEDVVELRKSIGAPGMAVLQFAFGGGPGNPHLPHNHELNQVVYTGTHDNDTAVGWWQSLPEEEKHAVFKYLPQVSNSDVSWALIATALSSVARTSMVTMQDILSLGSSARMNTPATQKGNWRWRIPSCVSFDSLSLEEAKLKELLGLYNRCEVPCSPSHLCSLSLDAWNCHTLLP